jgi:DNA-binding response OmpR family regulator
VAKILVIDDDPHVRREIVETLTTAGHDTFEAKDGRKGLDLFNVHRPELIVTDLVMPDKNGIELICELRAKACRVAIIATLNSGVPKSELYLRIAHELGADAAIAMPFDDTEFLNIVDKLLSACSHRVVGDHLGDDA